MTLIPVSKARGVLLALAAAGTLLGTTAGTAQAAPQEPRPGNWVSLTLLRGDDGFGDTTDVLLRCPAGRGSGHPHAERACRELAAVDGDIRRIDAEQTPCTMIYQPVTAYAYGMWDGHRVAYARDFANPCVLHASTGSVFALAR
ncbi:SSI family serine proteinase inhibitor [Streptomyces sp. YJ-C3]